MPYTSMTMNAPDGQWETRAYLDEFRRPLAHLTALTGLGGVHFAMIVTPDEAQALIDACERAIQEMRDLDSHPALAERD